MSAAPANIRGIFWMLVACLMFAAMWVLIRMASNDVHPFVVALWRNVLGVLWMLPMVIARPALGHSHNLRGYLQRVTSGLIGVLASYYAIANAPLAEVLAINYTAPLFATLGAALFLGERFHKLRSLFLAFGFGGMLLVLRPTGGNLSPGIIAAIVSALAIAFTFVALKHLTGVDDSRTVAFWSFLLAIPFTFPFALPFWSWPSAHGWLVLAALAATAAFGQLALTRAMALTDMSVIMPFDFLRFALVTAAGILLFQERYDTLTIVGGVIILMSTLLIAMREYQLRTRNDTPPDA